MAPTTSVESAEPIIPEAAPLPNSTLQFNVPVECRYYRSLLPTAHKTVIDCFAKAISLNVSSVVIPTTLKITDKDIRSIIKFFTYDYPDVWWTVPESYSISGGYICKVFMRVFEKKDANDANRIINDAIFAFRGTVDSDMPQAKLVHKIHDFIIGFNEGKPFASSTKDLNLAGFFQHKTGQNEVYPNAFQTVCLRNGIMCIAVHGKTIADVSKSAGEHSWNMVRVDGEWYHVDVNWDDPRTAGGAGDKFARLISHAYLCVSDELFFMNHSVVDGPPIPKATSMAANYHVLHNSFLPRNMKMHDIVECVARAGIAALDENHDQCEVLFDVHANYKEYVSLIKENIYNCLYFIRLNSRHPVALSSVSFISGDGKYPSFGVKFAFDEEIFRSEEALEKLGKEDTNAIVDAVCEALLQKKSKVLFKFPDGAPYDESESKFNNIVFEALREAKRKSGSLFLNEKTFTFAGNADMRAYCLHLKLDG